jgi:hypothetical protein
MIRPIAMEERPISRELLLEFKEDSYRQKLRLGEAAIARAREAATGVYFASDGWN